MAGQRRDYLMNQIDLLRQFVSRLVSDKANAGLDDMLQLSFSLQEKLFGMPPADFLQKDVWEQIEVLQRGESSAAAREKTLTYARLLSHTAALYDHRGRDDLASGARQLALHVALSLALASPADAETDQLVAELAGSLDPAQLHAPVRELLERFGAR